MKYVELIRLVDDDFKELRKLLNLGSGEDMVNKSLILEALAKVSGGKVDTCYYDISVSLLSNSTTSFRLENKIGVFNLSMGYLKLLGRLEVAYNVIVGELSSAQKTAKNSNNVNAEYDVALAQTVDRLHERLQTLRSLQNYWVPVAIVSSIRFAVNTIAEKVSGLLRSLLVAIIEASFRYFVDGKYPAEADKKQHKEEALISASIHAEKLIAPAVVTSAKDNNTASEFDAAHLETSISQNSK